jgi:muramoyltetrapeptide carboxypeptidase
MLHAHVLTNYKFASLHAPMAAAFNDVDINNPYIASIKDALEGRQAQYACEMHPFNNPGRANAQLVGGNLTLIIHAIGTASEINTKNRILFLEDVGEYLYNIDRMFQQLKRCGKLEKLAGLIIGGFTDVKDTERPFGKTAYEIIHEQLKDYDYPVCFGFPVSHSNENYALKIGFEYELDVSETGVSLQEASDQEME